MYNFRFLFLAFSSLLITGICACTSEEPEASVESLDVMTGRFTGTLPDGRTLDKTGIVTTSSSGGMASSAEGSFIYHLLSVKDEESDVKIIVELPHVKYSNEYLESWGEAFEQAVREHYSYAVVKDKLTAGDKPILSMQNEDLTQAFRVLVADEEAFVTYVSQGVDQTDSYLKIIDVVEATEMNDNQQQVNTLLVTFEMDVQLNEVNAQSDARRLTGLLTAKYWQN